MDKNSGGWDTVANTLYTGEVGELRTKINKNKDKLKRLESDFKEIEKDYGPWIKTAKTLRVGTDVHNAARKLASNEAKQLDLKTENTKLEKKLEETKRWALKRGKKEWDKNQERLYQQEFKKDVAKAEAAAAAAAAEAFDIVVPAGTGPGSILQTNLNGQIVQVTVPPGVIAGMKIRVQAPPPPPHREPIFHLPSPPGRGGRTNKKQKRKTRKRKTQKRKTRKRKTQKRKTKK
jgi:hypothetical protein